MITSSGVPSWNGAFAPVRKHRDYAHNSVWAHLKAEGASSRAGRTVMVNVDPITQEAKETSEGYKEVYITIDGKEYLYLVKVSGAVLTDEDIDKALDEYARNPVEGGRAWEDYVEVE